MRHRHFPHPDITISSSKRVDAVEDVIGPTIPEVAMVEGGIDHGRRTARGDTADPRLGVYGPADVEEIVRDRLAIHGVVRVFTDPCPAVKSQAVKLGVENPLAAHHVIRVEQRG